MILKALQRCRAFFVIEKLLKKLYIRELHSMAVIQQ